MSEIEKAPASAKPILLKDLIGDTGVDLYHKALKEERESRAFREAVFLASTKHYEGDKWNKKLVLHVGGPSACGKTFASSMIVRRIGEELMSSDSDHVGKKEGNYVTSIDGGIERDLSQMRQMVVQVALHAGYPGIEDLHSQTKLGIKGFVKKAVKKAKDLSMVIPNTFTSTIGNPLPGKASKAKKEMKAFDEDEQVVQVFSVVEGSKKPQVGDDANSTFKKQVAVMGESRAWYRGTVEGLKPVKVNQDLPCESKVYEKQHFNRGVEASNTAKAYIQAECRNSYALTYHNDLIHLQKVEGVWQVCGPEDPFDPKGENFYRMAAKDYNNWLLVKDRFPDLKEWHSHEANRSKAIMTYDSIPSVSKDIKQHNQKILDNLEALMEFHRGGDFSDKQGLAFLKMAQNQLRPSTRKTEILQKITEECYLKDDLNMPIDLDSILTKLKREHADRIKPEDIEAVVHNQNFQALLKSNQDFLKKVQEPPSPNSLKSSI